MLSPPEDLATGTLALALADGWGLRVDTAEYRPVGFGSHHWAVTDAEGTSWFATVDELETKRHRADEPLDTAFGRLRASLAAATGLRDHGCSFAVAPVSTRDGEPLVRLGDRFGLALYPFVDGRSFAWGEFATVEHRRAVLDMVVGVHSAPAAVRRLAMADGFDVPHRDELDAAIAGAAVPDCGPYARPVAQLLAAHATAVRRLIGRYDGLVAAAGAEPARRVLTHGEPHPGNTMRTPAGWLLIDWDTALVAPPERDLWSLDAGDGSLLDAYAGATGVKPRPSMLELYRLRWDLADLAVDVARFRRRHTGNRDDEESWNILSRLLAALPSRPG